MNTIIDLLNKPYISRLSILGGEPLLKENIESLADLVLITDLMLPDKKIWLWSGYLWEDIYSLAYDDSCHAIGKQKGWSNKDKMHLRDILMSIDILVDGPFIQEKKDLTLKWRGSSNQRVISVATTLSHGLGQYPVLYCK